MGRDARVCNSAPRTRSPRGLLLAALFTIAASGAPSAAAQATAPVPLDDPTYRLLDRLAAQLPAPEMIHGQRPYTRQEVARLVLGMSAALDALERSPSPPPERRSRYLRELIAALEAEYGAELARTRGVAGAELPDAAVDVVRLDAGHADSPFRGFTWNGLGSADNALVNPLLDYRHGRRLANGFTVGLEAEGRARVGARGVVFAGVRAAHLSPRSGRGVGTDFTPAEEGERDTEFTVRAGAARAKLGRWALQVGRAPLRRGQGRDAGLLLSDNGPPLDMVLFQNEELFRVPWLHRLLGPARFSAFFADLGPEQNFPHAKLYGNWLTFRPAPRLEVGGGFVVQDGGEGGPEQSFWERIGDYLLFVDVLFQGGSDFQASNKIAGVDFRLSVPEVGALLYGELYLDDFRVASWRHVREMLWPDAAHIVGVELARLDGVGRLSAWGEYQHSGIRMYRHYDYSSGVTRGRFLLGSGLGSDAEAVVGGIDVAPTAASRISLEAAWEARSHHAWTAPQEPHFHFEKVETRPTERRLRVQLAWEHRPLPGPFGVRVEAGAERVRNFAFEQGAEETNAALRVWLEWRPD